MKVYHELTRLEVVIIIPGNLKGEAKKILKIITMIIIVAIMIGFGTITVDAEDVNSLNPLYETLPAARFSEVSNWEQLKNSELPFSHTKGVFKGESVQGEWLGTVVHMVTTGYGGPMGILVAFNPKGNITKVDVFKHNETQCHIAAMNKGKFLEQFVGVALLNKLRLLIELPTTGKGDIQAMTGGTVTSRAVTEGVSEARKVFYKLYMDSDTKARDQK